MFISIFNKRGNLIDKCIYSVDGSGLKSYKIRFIENPINGVIVQKSRSNNR